MWRLAQKQLSFKECVTAHSPRLYASKMEEAKASYRYIRPPKGDVVGGRAVWIEVSSRGGMDRTVSWILVKVAE